MTLILRNVNVVLVSDLVETMSRRTGMSITEAQNELETALLEDAYHDDGSLDLIIEVGVVPDDELEAMSEYDDPEILLTLQFLEAWNDLLDDLGVETLLIEADYE